MSPAVKAALIAELGSLVYIAAWILAMQTMLCYVQGDLSAAWVVRAWRWWETRGERSWARTVQVYSRTPGEEPPIIETTSA